MTLPSSLEHLVQNKSQSLLILDLRWSYMELWNNNNNNNNNNNDNNSNDNKVEVIALPRILRCSVLSIV